MEKLNEKLPFLSKEIIDEFKQYATVKDFSKGTQILREEQYVKVLPIVLKGVVKVFSNFGEKELLLYYIEASQSCVMTFSAAMSNSPSRIFATTEENAKILLLPTKNISGWLKRFPEFNQLFYNQYDLRYTELLSTIQYILVDKIDVRLYKYLEQKATVTHQEYLKTTHSQIATELGTAREVISRALKKLELQEKIIQNTHGIKIYP
ncbi:Crp/Fnr family transcriptional regulator [Maribacter sp. MJ134]|uniref:Crp/Fnr family transcriptional regulator n=1 Tax=Maribacter sp. MJ134 TaxID=2496865 RepID=UPI000F84B559|nr:Crp/Fnr family transcriptional regulator [Maribacter sp. MJ134]AZQ59678.1 Crp/Fnr family transcriptional regulator [Maribacter sp. MJ134]